MTGESVVENVHTQPAVHLRSSTRGGFALEHVKTPSAPGVDPAGGVGKTTDVLYGDWIVGMAGYTKRALDVFLSINPVAAVHVVDTGCTMINTSAPMDAAYLTSLAGSV